ncbi:hypothetical protein SAMN04487970_103246 [Paenibacillus tianmuensis]|uniref:Uncharacterized protein n=1 Tax=Paenibacillus tianmuensis TaxID=624147 RepID=A0A1G4SPQ4_9BACL|nr:hypothetical protein SAMN04487970_103246 [Paenibacillus tianmuensis]
MGQTTLIVIIIDCLFVTIEAILLEMFKSRLEGPIAQHTKSWNQVDLPRHLMKAALMNYFHRFLGLLLQSLLLSLLCFCYLSYRIGASIIGRSGLHNTY